MTQTILAFLSIGLSLVALGIGILTTEKLATYPLMTELRRLYTGWVIFSLGFLTCATCIIISIFRLLTRASEPVKEFISPKLLERFEYEFESDSCSNAEIRDVIALGGSLLRARSQIDENFLLKRHYVNSGIIKCVRKRKSAKKKLSGFCISYPINKKCETLFEQGYIQGSGGIREEHICKTFEKAYSIYVSTVHGQDMPSRAFIVYLLKHDFRELLKKNKRLNYIYARPSTPEGYKLAKKFGLQPLPRNPELWRYTVEHGTS